ncbi:MAG: pirin family protein [Steroidobacteraceae bacterium]
MQRIETHAAEVGGLPVRRAVPSHGRRMVGAWCFLDHLGPVEPRAGGGLHVGPHPHIGLQTFTWMIEGEVVHRDSLGNEQVIRPGEVNLMTAGRGISHSEDSVAGGSGGLHATQLWIALPEVERRRAPAFEHHARLPGFGLGGFRATLLAGRACGESSPVPVYSQLVGIDLTASGPAAEALPLEPAFEYAVLVLTGSLTVADEPLAPNVLLYLGRGRQELSLRSSGASRSILVGGEPFGEEILLWWNFVARSREEIVSASAAWNAGSGSTADYAFGEVHGSPSPRLSAPEVPLIRR